MRNDKARWPMFRHVCLTAEALDRMLERTGVDPLVAAMIGSGDALGEAKGRCISCGSSAACTGWLAERTDVVRAPPAFCANAPFILRCLLTSESRRSPDL